MLPEEKAPGSFRPRYRHAEVRVAGWLCVLFPLVGVMLAFFPGHLPAYLLYLDMPEHLLAWADQVSLERFALGLAFVLLPLFWLLWLKLLPGRTGRRSSAVIVTCALVVAVGMVLQTSEVRWFFLEAVRVRAEYASYTRSITNWRLEQREFRPVSAKPTILLVGSSQINLGTDLRRLRNDLPGVQVEKKVLPGFGIMQYLATFPDIMAYQPLAVVCLLSEFDAFREDRLPSNRLRHSIKLPQYKTFLSLLGYRLLWGNRAELGDLGLALVTPLWRDRDLIRRLVLGFWWDDRALYSTSSDRVLGDNEALDLAAAREHLRNIIIRGRLQEASVESFAKFAAGLRTAGVELIVFEGMINPLATDIYPVDFRIETRLRLRQMSDDLGFVFVDETAMPRFGAGDFQDAIHLGATGRRRLTRFMAMTLAVQLAQVLAAPPP